MAAQQIGITGGIGSGKSLICKIFSCLGIPVYDADSRAKALMTTDGILMSAIKKEFGDLSYDEAGNLNRPYLASAVFPDVEKLERLNSLVHPRVAEDYVRWYESFKSDVPYVLKEAALLFESGSYDSLDRIVVVAAPVDVRVARVLRRDRHRTSGQVIDIMNRQWPDEEKVKRADDIIRNDESVLVIPQVISIHRRLTGELS